MEAWRSVLVGFLVLVVTFAVVICISLPTAVQSAEPTAYRMVVPHAVGGAADIYARALADRLAKVLGRPVVVENIPGAGAIRGMQEIIRAPKDGYTMGIMTASVLTHPSIYKDLPYDPVKDTTQISIVGSDVFLLVAHPGLAARNTKELIAMAKAQPGKLNYGTPGTGSIPHLAAELFWGEAGVKVTHVPYKGGSQLTTDVMGGHVQLAFMAVAQAETQLKAGTLRALGVSGATRHPMLPDVPTLAEAGYPNYNYQGWVALIGPPDLSQPIVKKLNSALLEVLKIKQVRDTFTTQGTIIVGSTPEEAARMFKTDLEKNARAVKQSGVKFE
jgi:tripartite-type tricarboxylate transporter receptor subunit TctC